MKRLTSSLVCLLALTFSGTVLGQYEGVIDMKMSTSSGQASGNIKMMVSKVGARSEMDMKANAGGGPGGPSGPALGNMKIVTVQKFSNPDTVYMLNDSTKSYSVLDLKETRKAGGADTGDVTYTVKKLGPGTVAGFACQNALLTSSKGDEMEICISKDFMTPADWTRMMQKVQNRGNLLKAIKDNGLEGLPVKTVMKTKGQSETVTMELVSAKKQSVPDSTFEVPAGYKETDTMGMFMSPEMQKQMQEMMKNLTPEQRKQFEDAMKKKATSGK